MPPPQVDSSPPEQAWQQDPWQQRKSRRRNAGSRETEQSTSHGTESPAASRSMEEPLPQEWPLPGATPKKRRRSPLAARDAEGSTPILTPPQTVVLRSIGKKEVSAFTGQEIREAVKQAGIDNMEGYTVHRNEKANAIAITTRDPLMVEKLLQVREIRKGEETLPLQPYKALAGNQCRGVIYLPGQGNTVTPESLREDIDCRDHKVAAARPIGAKGNTILVTFEGRVLPKKVRYMCEVLDVREYRPRPLVCFRCHGIGHKMDVCPRGSARCGTCGSEHDGMEGCAQAPKCVNCGGAHLATSNECPKRAIPPRRNDKRKTSGPEAHGKPLPPLPALMLASPPALQNGGTSYAAMTAGVLQPVVSPAHQSQQPDMIIQTFQAQQAGFVRMEKQICALTAAIHRLINTHNCKH